MKVIMVGCLVGGHMFTISVFWLFNFSFYVAGFGSGGSQWSF